MKKKSIFTLLLFSFIFTNNAIAQIVTMPNIIGSNMVLQQNSIVSVWGWAAPSTSVLVGGSWGKSASAISDKNGKWTASLQTPIAKPGEAPAYTLTVRGPKNTLMYTNILIGEVWLCSGQSNMWYPMRYFDTNMQGVVDSVNEIAAANYPNIRLFTVPTADSDTLVTNCAGTWRTCTPTTIPSFSAVAYYFGREIYNNKSVNVPIGLINSSYPGSAIQSWTKDSVLRSDAELKAQYIDKSYTGAYKQPSRLYNAMISPIVPFAIKGVIWYQGEANWNEGTIYSKANIAMLNDWRNDWGTDFSFYAVQLTPRYWNTSQTKDLTYSYSMFKEVQSNIMTTSKTGIVTTSDLLLNNDELFSPHPREKKEVGVRLALWALAKDYGQSIQHLGPTYESFTIESNKIRINFKAESLGTGLTTKDELSAKCFKIAGMDQAFYPALAVIDGNSIIISSPNVAAPIAVRYAMTDGARTNLMNKEGIAAYQFRTDAWANFTYIDVPDPTSAVAKINSINIELSPNPCSNKLYIKGINTVNQKIVIYDMMGKKIKSETLNKGNNATIDVSDLSAGLYSIYFSNTNFSSKKFMVNK